MAATVPGDQDPPNLFTLSGVELGEKRVGEGGNASSDPSASDEGWDTSVEAKARRK